MRAIFCCLMVSAAMAADDTLLTLDPVVMDEMKRAVFNGESAVLPVKKIQEDAEQGDMAEWQAAMDAAGTEMLPVRLLALLQRLNPDKNMGKEPELYAAALKLHVLAAAGNREAKVQLADSFSRGALPNGLRFIVDTEAAARWRP